MPNFFQRQPRQPQARVSEAWLNNDAQLKVYGGSGQAVILKGGTKVEVRGLKQTPDLKRAALVRVLDGNHRGSIGYVAAHVLTLEDPNAPAEESAIAQEP